MGGARDRQELERTARFFEGVDQFEAVPEVDIVIRGSMDEEKGPAELRSVPDER